MKKQKNNKIRGKIKRIKEDWKKKKNYGGFKQWSMINFNNCLTREYNNYVNFKIKYFVYYYYYYYYIIQK